MTMIGTKRVILSNPHSNSNPKKIPHSTFQNSGMGIGMWISIPHSTFQCTLKGRGMRYSQKKQFHIPHSKILEWNWNVDFHSTFHIPMHFSRVRNETFSKKTIPHSTFHIMNAQPARFWRCSDWLFGMKGV